MPSNTHLRLKILVLVAGLAFDTGLVLFAALRLW